MYKKNIAENFKCSCHGGQPHQQYSTYKQQYECSCHGGQPHQQYTNHKLVNIRGESCEKNDMTVCCPHMYLTKSGEYSATNEMTPFLYNGKMYELHTCCSMCAEMMKKLGDDEFRRIYNPTMRGNNLLIHHKDTKKPIQIMKLIENFKYNKMEGEDKLNWEYSQPIKVYHNIVERFGLPDVLAPQRGGIAIWHDVKGQYDPLYKSITVFDRHELRDELVAHACPAQHNDFLYSYIKIPILPEQLEDVNKLSGSVNYDMLKKELFARCANTCANVMTLFLATEIICSHINPANHFNIQKIHEEGLYGKHIKRVGDDKFMSETIEKLRSNIALIRNTKSQELPHFHWPGAFGDNCKKPN